MDILIIFKRKIDEYTIYRSLPILARFRVHVEVVSKIFNIVRVIGDKHDINQILINLKDSIITWFENIDISHCLDVYKIPWVHIPTPFHIGTQILSTYLLHNLGIFGSRSIIYIIDELPIYSKAWRIYRINVIGKAKPSIEASIVLSIIKDPLDTAFTCIPIEAEKIKEVGKYPCINMGLAPLSEVTILALSDKTIASLFKCLEYVVTNVSKCHILLIPWQVNLHPREWSRNEVKTIVEILTNYFKLIEKKGIVIVTPVGNHGIDNSIDPIACSEHVFSITGFELNTGKTLEIASKPPNPFYPNVYKPDFTMPGMTKIELVKENELTCVNTVGTSIAACFFTGVLALFNEYLKCELNKELTPGVLRHYIQVMGRKQSEITRHKESHIGHGLLTCTQIKLYVDYIKGRKYE